MKTHKLSALTIERLTDIKFNILAVPETFRMERVFQPEYESPCGTAGCIAGHAVAIKLAASGLNVADVNTWLPMEEATVFLDLTKSERSRLFLLSIHTDGELPNWPIRFERRYLRARSAKGRASVVADRIDHFIATDGEE